MAAIAQAVIAPVIQAKGKCMSENADPPTPPSTRVKKKRRIARKSGMRAGAEEADKKKRPTHFMIHFHPVAVCRQNDAAAVGLGRPHPFESGLDLGDQILRILQADMNANRLAIGVPLRCRTIDCGIAGNHQAFVAAPTGAHAEQFEAIEHAREDRAAGFGDHETKQARGAGEMPLPYGVMGITGASGMHDLLHDILLGQ
ncbi:MAG TPA: hypothetical protein VL147_22625, partial [Devosia sp.]|nr:hypothetical protein [Devosia sp.]